MAATFVKVTKLQNSSGAVASGSVTATAGNALIACVGIYYATSTAQNPTLAVTGGGTWVTAGTYDHHFTGNDNFCLAFASCLSATGGAQTVTLTWTVGGSPPFTIQTAFIYEFSGMATSSMLDALGTGASGTTSPITTTAQTNATPNDVMFACAYTMSSAPETHGSPANGWTMPTGADETSDTLQTGVSAYKIVSASASQSTSWTDSPAPSGGYASFQVAFKQGAAASVTGTAALTLQQPTVASAGTSSSGVTGTATAVLQRPSLVVSGTAGTVVTGNAALVLPTLALAGSGATDVVCSVALVLQRPAASGTGTGSSLPQHYYSTNFPLTENPISQLGVWSLGGTDALDWTNPRTTPGKVFGTQSGTDPGKYTDSIAIMKGTWGADQQVTATVFSTVANGDYFCEVELLLRFNITPHSVTGYEITMNVNPGHSYVGLNRWNGGPYNLLTSYVGGPLAPVVGVVNNGDVMRATIIGSTITLYQNGTQIYQVTDTNIATGNPGVGFYNEDTTQHADPSQWGFTQFTATTMPTGTGAPTLHSPVIASSGTLSLTSGPAALVLQGLTVAAAGTSSTTIGGTAALVMRGLSSAAAGTVSVPTSGTASLVLPGLTLAGVGYTTVTGSASLILRPIVLAAVAMTSVVPPPPVPVSVAGGVGGPSFIVRSDDIPPPDGIAVGGP